MIKKMLVLFTFFSLTSLQATPEQEKAKRDAILRIREYRRKERLKRNLVKTKSHIEDNFVSRLPEIDRDLNTLYIKIDATQKKNRHFISGTKEVIILLRIALKEMEVAEDKRRNILSQVFGPEYSESRSPTPSEPASTPSGSFSSYSLSRNNRLAQTQPALRLIPATPQKKQRRQQPSRRQSLSRTQQLPPKRLAPAKRSASALGRATLRAQKN